MRIGTVIALALAVAIAGCGGMRDKPELAQSQFESYIEVRGVQEPYDKTWLGQADRTTNQFLMSRIEKKTGLVKHLLYVNGIDKQSWRAASDEDARELDFISPGEHYRGRMVDYAAVIPEDVLVAKRSYGYRVKFKSLDGKSQIITVSPRQIAAQLDEVARIKARK